MSTTAAMTSSVAPSRRSRASASRGPTLSSPPWNFQSAMSLHQRAEFGNLAIGAFWAAIPARQLPDPVDVVPVMAGTFGQNRALIWAATRSTSFAWGFLWPVAALKGRAVYRPRSPARILVALTHLSIMTTPLPPARTLLPLLTLAGIQFSHVLDFMIAMPLGPILMQAFAIGTTNSACWWPPVSAPPFPASLAATFIDLFERKRVCSPVSPVRAGHAGLRPGPALPR